MILFHGTSTKFEKRIMRSRLLQPRKITGESTYDGHLISDENRVYMTNVYAIAFGMLAIEKHGGNILICAAKVDDTRIEPDTDFTDGGRHHLKFTNGLQCLESTGCISVVGDVEVHKMWVIGKKLVDELKKNVQLRIETGIRHKGFFTMYEEVHNYYLNMAKLWAWDSVGWRNDLGQYARI